MNGPLEITFRDIPKQPEIEALIRRKLEKLEEVHRITSCRVALERPQRHQTSGSPYRVRLSLTVPSGHELVVRREPGEGEMHVELTTIVRNAFDAARRQLVELGLKRRGFVKRHEEGELVTAVIDRVFSREDYGFIRTSDQRQVYFHRNSVQNADFDCLLPGTDVHFVEEEGEKGAQAVAVQVVDPTSR